MIKILTRLSFFLAFILIGFSADAQTQAVTGTVTDGSSPLPGVSIIVKGTTNGTSTDFDGKYTLDVASTDILIFSSIGYKTQEITVGNKTTIDVVLEESAGKLDEVVIVGYGTSNKRELTGAVGAVKGSEITNLVASNPVTALQGKLSGIQVESFGGQPGGTANVFIRGINSLSNADPLFIVDGLFVDNMDNVNANDIDNISVLKDAAAGAIYGLRAANGVVLITTNHGRRNKDIEVKFSSRIGIDTPSKKLDFIDGQQFTDFLNQRFINDGSSTTVTWNGVDTDWQEESLQSGIVEDYGFSLSGGGENSSFFASANYFNQDGILVGSGFKRINVRVNSDHNFGKFKLVQSLGITEGKLQENNWYGFDGVTAPTVAFSNPDNEGGFEGPSTGVQGPGGINQYGLATLEDNLRTTRAIFGNVKLDYNVTEALKVSASLGVDFLDTHIFQFTPTFFMSNTDAVRNVNTQNDLTDVRQTDVNVLFEPTLSYKKQFGDHKFSALLGSSYFRERQTSIGIYGQGTPGNNIRSVSALPSSESNTLFGENNTGILISYFGRLNYNFNDRYILSGTLRRDASSRFEGSNRQVGYFPSISGAWNISSEDFWDSETINYFKLRASYGELGSTVDEFYPAEGVFSINSATSFGGGLVSGIAQTVLVDPNLAWETTKTFDIGLDMSFLDSKINLSTDYYSKTIDDVLVLVNLPSTTGVSAPVRTNAGTLINKGLEFTGDYNKRDGDFTYKIGANISFNIDNTAEDIPNPILGPGIDEDLRVVNRTSTGQPIGAYYGYIVEDRVDPATGNFIRVDTDGVPGITVDDQTIIGDPTPDFVYGINFTGEYKKFDFGLNFSGVQGNEIYNLSRYYNILWQDGGKLSDVLNSWTPTNTDTNIPIALTANNDNRAPSSFFVEDGSYFRLKNLEVGFNLKEDDLGIKWVKEARLSFNVQNVFVLTKYSGYDPDVSSTNGGRANLNLGVPGFRPEVNPLLSRGLDARAYPNARSFMFRVQLTF